MSWRRLRNLVASGWVPLAVLLMTHATAYGQNGYGPNGCSGCSHCPPAYRHIGEGPPNISIKRGCPKPICSPCTNERWGYYETCWRRWPWPPNWSHCPVPPPGAYFDGTLAPPPGGTLHMPTPLPGSNGTPPRPPQQKLSMDIPPGR
jgi:hypothetical protein